MKLLEILDILNTRILTEQVTLQKSIESVYCADLMSDVLSFSVTNSLLVTGLTNTQVVRTAEMAAIEVIVFVQGKQPDLQTVSLAEEKDILMLVTDFSMFETCGRLYEKGLRSQCQPFHRAPITSWHAESG